ncbi:MAG TPA: hypothetical protein H9684_09710 [Firmicutes bacterium]|nr:hypothetical protein [Bacillota bacterium]
MRTPLSATGAAEAFLFSAGFHRFPFSRSRPGLPDIGKGKRQKTDGELWNLCEKSLYTTGYGKVNRKIRGTAAQPAQTAGGRPLPAFLFVKKPLLFLPGWCLSGFLPPKYCGLASSGEKYRDFDLLKCRQIYAKIMGKSL